MVENQLNEVDGMSLQDLLLKCIDEMILTKEQ